MNTERELLENLMAMAEQSREAQKKYFSSRTGINLRDAKIKEDALDNILKHLRQQGYSPQKIVSKAPDQAKMF
mgnify:CR=1 FL=1